MKALKYSGDGTVRIIEVPKPIPQGDEVLIKVKAAGVCGTDVGDYIYAKDFLGIPGHEVAGIVEDPGTSRFHIGDRVMLSVHINANLSAHCMRMSAHSAQQESAALRIMRFARRLA